MASGRFFPSGLDPVTGRYLLDPGTPAQLGRQLARADLAGRLPARGRLAEGVDWTDLSTTGWGIVFARGDGRAKTIREALAPLIALRRQQVSSGGRHYFQQYRGRRALPRSRGRMDWLLDAGGMAGEAHPDDMPCYLLLIGDPKQIPFEFQFGLSRSRAVGRLWFEEVEQYRDYAERVVSWETGETGPASREVALFAPQHPDDPATAATANRLALPLLEHLPARAPGWTVGGRIGTEATKQALRDLLETPPALLLTAGHGAGPSAEGEPDLLGGLVCQDWPGPSSPDVPSPDWFFGADDVPTGSDLSGLISFHLACYSGGLPVEDPIAPEQLPPTARPRLSLLPPRLLSRGALAVVGHADRAYLCSFLNERGESRPRLFLDTLSRLLRGVPVGAALRGFSERCSDLENEVFRLLEKVHAGETIDPRKLANRYIDAADARGFLVLGDPAVRLAGAPP